MDRPKGESWLSRIVIRPVINCNVFPFFSDVSWYHTFFFFFRSQIHDEKFEEKVFGEVENRFVRLFLILWVWS